MAIYAIMKFGRSYTTRDGDDVDYGSLVASMRERVESSRLLYTEGLFYDSFEEANNAIRLWDAQDELDRYGTTARELWGDALLMAYKASVADTKSTMHEAVRALITQRQLMLTIEEASFDAGSELIARFHAIHTALAPLRGARNRRDDRIHDMVPQLSPIISRAQLQRFTTRQKGRIKRILVR